MSSLASSAEPRPRLRRPRTRTITVPWAGPGAWLSLSLALVIVLCAFVARGGVRLEPTTTVEIGLMLGGAGLVIADCLVPRERQPLYGGWAVLAFALLAAYTALSILWSLAPVGLVAGGQPHVRLPGDVRGRDRARAARAGPLGGAALRRAGRRRA